MKFAGYGELVPQGGGEVIPLVRERMTLGRRDSCDICFKFPNVSGLHCELAFVGGHWIVRDLGSTNGIKVNGARVAKKVMHPGDTLTIAKRTFRIDYTPTVGKQAMEEILEETEDAFDQPLLEKAGLARPQQPQRWLDDEDDEED